MKKFEFPFELNLLPKSSNPNKTFSEKAASDYLDALMNTFKDATLRALHQGILPQKVELKGVYIITGSKGINFEGESPALRKNLMPDPRT